VQPPVGVLADVTGTILNRLGLKNPEEVTGQSLTEAL
jgi:bisphosphoglycerate-independent phosphoglycerate mutase (AlkP superfamily)